MLVESKPRVAKARSTHRWRHALLVGSVMVAAIGTIGSLVIPRVLAVSYTLTDSVKMRREPRAVSAYDGVAPKSSSVDVLCQQWGEAQGPNGNTLWLKVNGSGRSNWWVSDAWTSSPHKAADKTVGIANVAFCNAPTPAPPASGLPAVSMDTKVWVGAPFAGTWPGNARSTDSLPSMHAPVYTVPGHNWKHDWAMDFYATAGTQVKVFAAPKDNRLDSRITAQVLSVTPTCLRKSTETVAQQVARGGYVVYVGVYDGGVRVGTITYAHVNPAFDASYRGGINRWGGLVGTVGQYTNNSCWQVTKTTGHHVHIELSNENSKNMACYRPGVAQNASLPVNDYIGYLGGAFVTSRKQACPTSA